MMREEREERDTIRWLEPLTDSYIACSDPDLVNWNN